MELQNIIRQHGKSVAFVFQKLGIKAPVTSQNIFLATIIYKNHFIDELEKQLALETANNFSGVDGTNINETRNTLENILNTVAESLGVYFGTKNKVENSPAPVASNNKNSSTNNGSSIKTYLLIAVAVIVVLAILLFNRKNS